MSEVLGLGAAVQATLVSRCQLISVLLSRRDQVKSEISESLTKRSPLERYDDIEPNVREKWEEELAAAIEAEYRRQRTDLLSSVQWWLRDVWLASMRLGSDLLSFPQLAASVKKVAARVSPSDAMKNLKSFEEMQRLLFTNVQEALVLEVGLLKLKL